MRPGWSGIAHDAPSRAWGGLGGGATGCRVDVRRAFVGAAASPLSRMALFIAIRVRTAPLLGASDRLKP